MTTSITQRNPWRHLMEPSRLCSWRRDGRAIELLGHYNPLHAANELGIVVKADRIKYWLGVGAQPSDTVAGILHKR
ncbi:hypothetical protein R1flu_020322 [Riccia fluitans]|uniref:Ribosomal protein S16 n=1 Tax=Riccia fluitans TaxID=41844 RepID=A0ABD1ZPQ3_9MARC